MSVYDWVFRCTDPSGVTHYYNASSPSEGVTTRCDVRVPWPSPGAPGVDEFLRWFTTDVDCMACIAFRAAKEAS